MNRSSSSCKLSLVIPVLNEEKTVELFIKKVNTLFDPSLNLSKEIEGLQVEFIFVNDGSQDQTLEKLLALQSKDQRIKIIDLSRHFGKEAALSAGLDQAQGDAIVPMDVDLQDPPSVILEMIAKWKEGYEVVVGQRTHRDSDSWFKRVSAHGFYWLHNRIAHPLLPIDAGDFRLMDRCVLEALKQLPESRRFMKGLFAWVGFKTTSVFYQRPERSAGSTKFNGWRLWNFALEGITSFSTMPLRIWMYIGWIVSFCSFIFAFFIAVRVLWLGRDVPGYASLIVAVTLLGGLQLTGIGVLGEYLGRTYIESKRRPIYLIRKIYSKL